MDSSKDIHPVSALKKQPAELIAQARERRSPIVITQNGQPTAVLVDVESYEQTRKALHLLRLAVDGDRAHARGEKVSNDRAIARLRGRLKI
jgi:prevent-host-death family protein